MKNIFKTLALALPLASTSLIASDTTDINALLADDETKLSVIRYFDGDADSNSSGTVQARIKAQKGDDTRRVALPVVGTLTDAGWQNNDDALTAHKTFIGNVEVGRDDFLRVAAPYNTDAVAYTVLPATQEPDAELTVGSTVTVNAVKKWERPDETTYSRVGEALFRLRLEETRTAVGGEFKILRGVRREVKARGFKSTMGDRHTIDNYHQTKVVRTTTKLAVESDEVIGEPTVAEYIALAHQGSYESWENESRRPQGDVPAGYKIGG